MTDASSSAPRELSGVDAFEEIAGLLDYPMFVVTTAAESERSGCLVGFASQVSIDPPRFLVGVSVKNHTYGVARRAEHVNVHVLRRGDLELARLFGTETGDEIDKFAHCAWRPGPHGLPVLADARAWFCGRVLERLPVGDHVAFLLEPESGGTAGEGRDLVTFSDVRDLEPGHDA